MRHPWDHGERPPAGQASRWMLSLDAPGPAARRRRPDRPRPCSTPSRALLACWCRRTAGRRLSGWLPELALGLLDRGTFVIDQLSVQPLGGDAAVVGQLRSRDAAHL